MLYILRIFLKKDKIMVLSHYFMYYRKIHYLIAI